MKRAGDAPSTGELVGLGVFLAGVFLVPLIVGLLLDLLLHTTPIFLMLGLLVGIIAAGAGVYTRFRRYL
jgi:F0F1-type ATP synthase assembly protein I